MPVIVLPVRRDADDDMRYFVVDMTPEYASLLLDRLAIAERIEDVQLVTYEDDSNGRYCASSHVPQEIREQIEGASNEHSEFAIASPDLLDADEPRTDYKGLNVYPGGYVSFVVEPHIVSDVALMHETAFLWKAALNEIAAEKPVLPVDWN